MNKVKYFFLRASKNELLKRIKTLVLSSVGNTHPQEVTVFQVTAALNEKNVKLSAT